MKNVEQTNQVQPGKWKPGMACFIGKKVTTEPELGKKTLLHPLPGFLQTFFPRYYCLPLINEKYYWLLELDFYVFVIWTKYFIIINIDIIILTFLPWRCRWVMASFQLPFNFFLCSYCATFEILFRFFSVYITSTISQLNWIYIWKKFERTFFMVIWNNFCFD